MLLDLGADPDLRSQGKRTPMMVSAAYNHDKCTRLLLEHKADPYCADVNGYTPMHFAALNGCCEVVGTLFEYGVVYNKLPPTRV